MNNLLRNIVTAVLLAFGWVAPLCAAPLTQAEVDALYERIDALYDIEKVIHEIEAIIPELPAAAVMLRDFYRK